MFPLTWYMFGSFMLALLLVTFGYPWQALIVMLIGPYISDELEWQIVLYFTIASCFLGTMRAVILGRFRPNE